MCQVPMLTETSLHGILVQAFRSLPDGVVVVDDEGRVLFSNPAFLGIIGAREDEVPAGTKLASLGDGLESLRRGLEGTQSEHQLSSRDGSKRIVTVNAHALSAGATAYFLDDVTEKERGKDRLEKLSGMTQRLVSAATVLDVAEILLDALDEAIGWDAAFVDVVASETQQFLSPGHLLIPVIQYDIVEGRRGHTAPPRAVLREDSPTRRSLREGPLLINRGSSDLKEGSLHLFGDSSRPSQSLMYVPIGSGQTVVGVVSIQSYTPNRYGAAELELAGHFAEACRPAVLRVRSAEMIRLLEMAVRHANDMIVITATDLMSESGTSILFVNSAFERETGYASSELVGKSIRLLHGPLTDKSLYEKVTKALSNRESIQFEIVNYRRDGTPYVVEISTFPIADKDSMYHYFVSVQRNVTERKQLEERLRFFAFHDPLTKLANRSLLTQELSKALVRAPMQSEKCALLFVDLDGFKDINDRIGHDAGDEALIEVALRLESCIRGVDTAARYGGDEFAILLQSVLDEAGATSVATRILEALREPINLAGHQIVCRASIGICFSSGQGDSAEDMIRHADAAMYRAKTDGKDRFEIHRP